MVDNTFISFLISSGYAGIQVNKEGNFKLNLISFRFLAWTLVSYLLTGLFLYFRLQHLEDGMVAVIVDALPAGLITMNPLFTIPLFKVGKSSYFNATGFSLVRIVLFLLVTRLMLFPCAFLNLQRFEADTFTADVVLVVLIVADYGCYIMQFEFLYVIIKSFINELKHTMGQNTIIEEDIKNIQDKYETMKSGLQLLLMVYFSLLQILIILTIAQTITMPKYLVLTTFCLGMLIVIGTLVYAMEKVYAMLAEFGLKADECLLQAASYREMARLQKALDRLEGSGKASGWGFFEVDRSTLTAMLSTTLTYTIIMNQMAPSQ